MLIIFFTLTVILGNKLVISLAANDNFATTKYGDAIHLCEGSFGNQCQKECSKLSKFPARCESNKCMCHLEGNCKWYVLKFIRILQQPSDNESIYGLCTEGTGDGECNYRCLITGFQNGGRCENNVCKCNVDKNLKVLTYKNENKYLSKVCTRKNYSSECARYCRGTCLRSGSCQKDKCICGECKNERVEEISKDIEEVCLLGDDNILCKRRCLQLHFSDGLCERNSTSTYCLCKHSNNKWRKLMKKDYYTKDKKEKVSDLWYDHRVENKCVKEECDSACYYKHQFGGRCQNGQCECRIKRTEKSWTKYNEIVRRISHENTTNTIIENVPEEYTDIIERCSTEFDKIKCKMMCNSIKQEDGLCYDHECYCRRTDKNWKSYNELFKKYNDREHFYHQVCRMDHGEGDCNYKCAGLGSNAGRCIGGVCQCLFDKYTWTELNETLEHDYKNSICNDIENENLCFEYCKRLKNTTGSCDERICTCDDYNQEDESTQLLLKVTDYCQNGLNEDSICDYKCRQYNYDKGQCIIGVDGNRKCECVKSKTTTREFVEREIFHEENYWEMVEKENELENSIISRPCIDDICAIGCISQKQFDGVCVRNVCQCKTSRIEENWFEYRKIVTERKTFYREERIIQIEEQVFNPELLTCSSYAHEYCSKLCASVNHEFGKCNLLSRSLNCLCSTDEESWINYVDIKTNITDLILSEETCVNTDCYDKCSALQRDGDCSNHVCKCYDKESREWVKYTDIIEKPSSIDIPNRKTCRVGWEGHCTYLCQGVENQFGKCSFEKNENCYCSKDRKTWTKLNNETREIFLNNSCKESTCLKYCARFSKALGTCNKNTCECGKPTENSLIQQEILDLCDNSERKNVDCKFKCIQLGFKNGSCFNNNNQERICRCKYNDNKWKKINKNNYFEDGKTKVNEKDFYKQIIEERCLKEKCDFACYAKKQFAGDCLKGVCSCKTSLDENNWATYENIVRTYEEDIINRDDTKQCKVKKCHQKCSKLNMDGDCINNNCKCYDPKQNEWKNISEFEKNVDIPKGVCKLKFRDGDCTYQCRGLGYKEGKCRKGNCECTNNRKTWKRIDKTNEEEYRSTICTGNNIRDLSLCPKYCRHIKNAIGKCEKDFCECDENQINVQKTRTQLLNDELCENENQVHRDCRYTCKNVLNHSDGKCRISKKNIKRCFCQNGTNWQKLTTNELYRKDQYIVNKTQFENDIIYKPCNDLTCSIACSRQRQFNGKCNYNECQCKTSSTRQTWHKYKEIITERTDFFKEEIISTPTTDASNNNEICSDKDCNDKCNKHSFKGTCQKGICQCYDSRYNKTRDYNELLEDSSETDNNNQENTELCEIQNCHRRCSQLSMDGDCINNNCKCYDSKQNEWKNESDFGKIDENADAVRIKNSNEITEDDEECTEQCNNKCIEINKKVGECHQKKCYCMGNYLEGFQKYEDLVRKDRNYSTVCSNKFGESICNYRCKGMQFQGGKCDYQEKCRCFGGYYNDDLTNDIENEYKKYVCNTENKDIKCSNYCWRFSKSSGKCMKNICECNDDNNEDTEIINNIYELCDDHTRGDIDCEYKCLELGHINGTCNHVESQNQCSCQNCNGTWNPLTKNDYFESNNKRKDNLEDFDNKIIEDSCLSKECDIACHRQNLFAGQCIQDVCHCKISRREENWHTYEEIVKRKIIEQVINKCNERECSKACKSLTWESGSCEDKLCQCNNKEGIEKKLVDIINDYDDININDKFKNKCDRECEVNCTLIHEKAGECQKGVCHCIGHKDSKWRIYDELVNETPDEEEGPPSENSELCNNIEENECYEKCHDLRMYSGQCKHGYCECQKTQITNNWRPYEEIISNNETVFIKRNTSFPAINCFSHDECEKNCTQISGSETGICSDGQCECQTKNKNWHKIWEVSKLERITELDNILIDELSKNCIDNNQCDLMCKSYNHPFGKCENRRCKCGNNATGRHVVKTTTLKKIVLKETITREYLTVNETEILYTSCVSGNACKRMCQSLGQSYGDCNAHECQCMDNFQHMHWTSIKEVIYRETHTVIETYEEYENYVTNKTEKEKQPMCISGVDQNNICHENCKSYKQYEGKCKKNNGCYCRKRKTWRSYDEIKKHTEREKALEKLFNDCDDTNQCREECKSVGRINGKCLDYNCTCSDDTSSGNQQYLQTLINQKESTQMCVPDTCKQNCDKFKQNAECEKTTCYCTDEKKLQHDFTDIQNKFDRELNELAENCNKNENCRNACNIFNRKSGTCSGKKCECSTDHKKELLKDILMQHNQSDEYIKQQEVIEEVAKSELCPGKQGSQKCIVQCIRLNQTQGRCTSDAVCQCQEIENAAWRTYEEIIEMNQLKDDYELCTQNNDQHIAICTKKCKATGRENGSCAENPNECSCLNNKGIWEKLQEKDPIETTNNLQPSNNSLVINKKETEELIKNALEAGSIKQNETTKFILCKYTTRHQNRCRTLCKGVGHKYGKCYSNVCLCKQQKGTWKRLKSKYVDFDKIQETIKTEPEEEQEEVGACSIRFYGRVRIHCLQNITRDLQDNFCKEDCQKLNRPGGKCDQKSQRCACNFHSDFYTN